LTINRAEFRRRDVEPGEMSSTGRTGSVRRVMPFSHRDRPVFFASSKHIILPRPDSHRSRGQRPMKGRKRIIRVFELTPRRFGGEGHCRRGRNRLPRVPDSAVPGDRRVPGMLRIGTAFLSGGIIRQPIRFGTDFIRGPTIRSVTSAFDLKHNASHGANLTAKKNTKKKRVILVGRFDCAGGTDLDQESSGDGSGRRPEGGGTRACPMRDIKPPAVTRPRGILGPRIGCGSGIRGAPSPAPAAAPSPRGLLRLLTLDRECVSRPALTKDAGAGGRHCALIVQVFPRHPREAA